jgi:hypothetical protein
MQVGSVGGSRAISSHGPTLPDAENRLYLLLPRIVIRTIHKRLKKRIRLQADYGLQCTNCSRRLDFNCIWRHHHRRSERVRAQRRLLKRTWASG